ALESVGFKKIRQTGSHVYMAHKDGCSTVVPFHKGEDLRRGLIRSILKDLDLTIGDYLSLRSRI
ncbi:MAG: hypothetical protein COV46_00255, partial [Deltaproteobacteria bacterium CG11_big_fil_rev_8_21_14_0_20_49_13]